MRPETADHADLGLASRRGRLIDPELVLRTSTASAPGASREDAGRTGRGGPVRHRCRFRDAVRACSGGASDRRRRAGQRQPRLHPRRARPTTLPDGTAAAARLGAAGARRTTATCCASRCPRRSRQRASTRADVIGIATDFTACTMVPDARRRHAAVRGATVRRPAARLREALEAPRRPGAGRPDQRARRRARRDLAAPLRRADLLGVGVRQGPAALRGGPRDLRSGWSAGSRRPTGSCGSCAGRTCATRAPPATRASSRTAQYPVARTSSRSSHPGSAGSSTDKLEHPIGQLGDAGRPADRRGGRVDRAARGHRRRGRATSTRTSPRRPRRPSSPGRWSRSWAPRPAT